MDMPLDAEVTCTDGKQGRSVCLIVNPVDKKVTHLVVRTKGLMGQEYLVPTDLIVSSTAQEIRLRCTSEELSAMAPFVRSQFVGPEDPEFQYYVSLTEVEDEFLWPYMVPDYGTYVSVEEVPHDELGIHRGAHVEAADGHIGRVDEFIVNPENSQITHLVMSRGHLWGEREVIIPVSEIGRIQDDTVFLKLDKHAVKELPAVRVRRGRA